MQGARTAIRFLGSSSSHLPRKFNLTSSPIYPSENGIRSSVSEIQISRTTTRNFAQLAYSNSTFLDKEEVTSRVLDLLKSIPFVDPSKVTPIANFEKDLKLDVLDSVEIMMAAEEEFAVDIPNNDAEKFSTTAHLIDYIAAHPQAK